MRSVIDKSKKLFCLNSHKDRLNQNLFSIFELLQEEIVGRNYAKEEK